MKPLHCKQPITKSYGYSHNLGIQKISYRSNGYVCHIDWLYSFGIKPSVWIYKIIERFTTLHMNVLLSKKL